MSLPAKCALAHLALLASWPAPLQAHDIYTGVRDRYGVTCCDERDCRPTPYRMTPAGVEMLVDGRWMVVPDYAIQYRTLPGDSGETAGGHWCGFYQGGRIVTHCVILPPNSSALSPRDRP